MKGLPLPVVSAINPAVGHLFWWQQSVRKQVGPILEGGADRDSAGARQTIFHALRDSPLPQQEKTLDRLCDEAEIMTGAGSETTAQAMTRLMFYLKHAPETLVEVRRELDGVVRKGGPVPSWIELQRLPYLSAAIKEAIRLSYGVTTRLPRICHEDIRYKDWIIPAGTPVSMTPHDVLTDPDVFPEPHTYRPERWLEAGTAGRKLDRYFVPFGKGARQCPGMNLAHAELFLTASTIISRFDWDLYETGLDDVTCQHDFFVAVGKLDSKGPWLREMEHTDQSPARGRHVLCSIDFKILGSFKYNIVSHHRAAGVTEGSTRAEAGKIILPQWMHNGAMDRN
ncbi:trichodiene oxygenase [Verticillium dahliae VdLs.17]|uniref:Trichodiene oxygenase n=1 Tax=Verticillium dahliae (strain VdLs.17 / ATCC MYA-4575 / FGSC 10137) TaxID=498257 RepID=G2XIU8_VERDV|nr:trichodiene oxygenase [Verticillium dahliae VdLs.17]EGY20442.1 trichodiene oxygenase [Verticillium dahliae VdLs.17]KAH6700746.1 trichodiene oxygenase [Verticillium dahliae]